MLLKRGITPLIATVLLIGFTVALAAVIITWGGSFVDSMTKRTTATTDVTLKCVTELKFSISRVTCDEANQGHIKSVTVENNGNLNIVELTLRASPGDEGDVKADKLDLSSTPLGSFEVKTFTGTSTPALINTLTINNPMKIDIIAKIEGSDGKDPVLCTQNVQDYNLKDVPNCQLEQVVSSTTTSSSTA
ncbi:MAG: archaellin/type IV pilin N-terminal domain-containing protein [Nanoarchaeota archaeon]